RPRRTISWRSQHLPQAQRIAYAARIVFVLEVDVSVRSTIENGAERARPTGERLLVVGGLAEPQVDEVGGLLHGRVSLLAVDRTPGHGARGELLPGFSLAPARVAELHREA